MGRWFLTSHPGCFSGRFSVNCHISLVNISLHFQLWRRHIGYLPEHNPLYMEMPVIDYLHFCAALQDMLAVLLAGQVTDCASPAYR